MIDRVRPTDPNMYDMYQPPVASPPAAPRLEDFQVFKKGPGYIYGNLYTYDPYTEAEIETAGVYHNLISPPLLRDYGRGDWHYKLISDWNEDDTINWIIDIAQRMGYNEFEFPYYHFKMSGIELKQMNREDVLQRMSYPNMDLSLCRRLTDAIFDTLQSQIGEDLHRETSVLKYAESDPYGQPEASQTMLDLDSCENTYKYMPEYRHNMENIMNGGCDSSDADEAQRSSPEYSYGSDGSKSGDEDDKRKSFKRPPGRPKGSGRKINKRARNVPVPEFLRNLLLDPEYCPSIIKWEDYSKGKFRFVNPDAVAKLWGKLKHNENMTFEKFSRAMRYHYRQLVLLSVPSARLVYMFGPKGPDYKTENPNFENIKVELTSHYLPKQIVT